MKAHETTPLSQPEWDTFLAEAKANIDNRTASPTTRTATRHRSVRRGLSTVAVSGLALCAVLVVTSRDANRDLVTPTPNARPTVAPATSSPAAPVYTTASQVLAAAAVSSAAQTASSPEAEYWRVESKWQREGDDIPGGSMSGPRIMWQGHTSKGVLYQDGRLTKMPPASFSMQQTSFSWDELTDLTTSPKKLEKMLRAETAGLRNDPDAYMFKFIFELLAESPAPPQLRSALWKVAAGLKGATLSGQQVDAIGRSGWSITLGEVTYIVDTKTGNILETFFTHDGTVSYRSTIISAGPAATAPRTIDEVAPST